MIPSVPNIKVRPATIADIPTLLQFEQGVIATERPYDPTLAKDPITYYDLPFMIEAEHIELLVAELDGQLIGSGYARIEEAKHYLKYKQYAYLGFMFTKPEHRGKAVNKIIIEALRKWCAAKGMTELRLEVYVENLPAIKAYEKAGFDGLLLQMRSDVGN